MKKDPTEFRKRFAAWKNGKQPYKDGLPAYEDGKEDEFDVFLKTLPDNQSAPGAYNTRRYWELNGKPKNFAEAIGIGMYNVQKDNGILGWHANSVSYNDKNDTYEFMKPNYHPTRWMEQVYGYDKDQAFQKDWKVEYNGPMLSDRYVRREKPGFKIKGGQLPKFADGKESVRVGEYNVYPNAIGASELNVTTPEIIITGKDRRPSYQRYAAERSTYDPELITNFTGLIPGIGDVQDVTMAVDAYNKGDYLSAGVLGAGLVLPNVLEKTLKPIVKPLYRFTTNAAFQKKAIDAARKFNFPQKWDDDTYMRWLLNGQKTPDFKFVWHGRGTNRGDAKDVVRNYSHKDVGLHVTENKSTAKKFAKDNGVVYQAIDYGQYPDAIYKDLGTWQAPNWSDSFSLMDTPKSLSDQIENLVWKFPKSQEEKAALAQLYRSQSVNSIGRTFNLDKADLSKYSVKFKQAGDDEYAQEEANRLFANYLSERGVKFRYKNDYEGGGFASPSTFIADMSDLHWVPTKRVHAITQEMVPTLDWKTRTIIPGKETWIRYK